MRSTDLSRQDSWAPIEKCETDVSVKKVWGFPSFKYTQFPLTLAYASIVYVGLVLSLEQSVIDFDLWKQKSFGPGQINKG